MSQFEKALLELRLLILSGEFEANSRLPEVLLSERIGISRTPLRQAMDRLVEEGLLERLETGGCRVASFSMNDIIDSIEIRGVMEGTAARLAAERGADPKLIKRMRVVLDELDKLVIPAHKSMDFAEYVHLNEEFHDLLSLLCQSQVVRREVRRAKRLPLASPSAFMQGQEFMEDFQASLRLAQHQHREIFDAIINREGARAEALTREHARLAKQNLNYVLNSKPDLAEKVPGLVLVSV
ncbi:MAG: GntR family transcriptional regulator [Thiolinea sp.]